MPSDSVTFAAAFGAIALAIGAYLWRLERAGRRLEARLRTLEAASEAGPAARGDAAKPKTGGPDPGRRA